MKTLKIFILIAGVLAFTKASSQAPKTEVGIRGGLNLSSMSVEDADDNNILPGFQAGVYSKIPLGNGSFSLQPELLYSGKGLKKDGTEYNLNYLELPLKVAYNLAPDFNFHAGPYVGYLLNAKVKGSGQLADVSGMIDPGAIDNSYFNNLDVGLTAGLGFSLNRLDLGFDYSFGILPTADENKALQPILGSAKNNVIQVHVGYRF